MGGEGKAYSTFSLQICLFLPRTTTMENKKPVTARQYVEIGFLTVPCVINLEKDVFRSLNNEDVSHELHYINTFRVIKLTYTIVLY